MATWNGSFVFLHIPTNLQMNLASSPVCPFEPNHGVPSAFQKRLNFKTPQNAQSYIIKSYFDFSELTYSPVLTSNCGNQGQKLPNIYNFWQHFWLKWVSIPHKSSHFFDVLIHKVILTFKAKKCLDFCFCCSIYEYKCFRAQKMY